MIFISSIQSSVACSSHPTKPFPLLNPRLSAWNWDRELPKAPAPRSSDWYPWCFTGKKNVGSMDVCLRSSPPNGAICICMYTIYMYMYMYMYMYLYMYLYMYMHMYMYMYMYMYMCCICKCICIRISICICAVNILVYVYVYVYAYV